MHVEIVGDGLAAWCCARLLTQSGFDCVVKHTPRRHPPVIMVGESTQRLLCEFASDPALFHDLPVISRRFVRWGPGAEPIAVGHSAVAVSEESLLAKLWSKVDLPQSGEADWTVFTTSRGEELHFGSRKAQFAEVELARERGACWIESFEQGWMFLIAGDGPMGWLISVGGRARDFLDSSRLIAPQISSIRELDGEVAAYPRIASRVGGDRWIACGTAAMAFDPLCGDGTGNAIREAILAAAVLRSVARGKVDGLIEHYDARLALAFRRHLEICRDYYSRGGSGEWWTRELEMLERGIAWTQRFTAHHWRYRLEGLDLLPL